LGVIFLWTCGGGGGGDSAPTEPTNPYVVELASLSGNAQKGPFNNGTAVNIAELTNTLSPTGRNFSTQITDNSGLFSVANVQLTSPYVELRANGYYFNEVANEVSSGQLTLYALSDLTNKTSVNVNLLSHLEKNRIATLMAGTAPLIFTQAKNQAQEEVLAIFDYSRAGMPNSELLDITQAGANNAKLLAISAIVQGDLTVGQMSELLANISTDISTDGTLDNTAIQNTLIDNSKNLDLAQIRANLEARYTSLGITVTIPDFETEVHQFLKPPVVQDMSLSTDEDTAINITLAGSDPEGESITYSLVDDSNNATVTISGNVANYVPNAHFNGTDTFTYKANDGTSDSNIGTVTITVNAIDDDPNTNDVSATTDEDTAVDISLTADEYDGQNYSFGIIANPSNGTVSLSGTTATYTPNQDWNGTDTFTFEATDDRIMFGKRNVATATITVNAINDAPTSNEVNGASDEDTAVNIELSATDVEGDNLTYSIVSDVSNGTTSISGSTLTYTPNQDWNGTDTFTYKVNDGTVDSNTSNGTVTIAAVNDAPVANDVTISTNETRFISVDITLDATDVEGDNLTYSIPSEPSDGTASLNGNVVTYVPTTDWNGEDSFTYKANDGTVDSNTATVTITVNAVNDAPTTGGDINASTNEDTAVDITMSGTDVDGDALTYHPDAPNSEHGSASLNGNVLTFTPTADWNGTTTINYKVNDGNLDSNTSVITITVNAVEDAPIAHDISASVSEDTTGNIIKIKGDNAGATDAENDDLTLTILSLPSNGIIYNDAGGGLPDGDALAVGDELTSFFTIYNPNANYYGTDTFTFKANDGTADSNTGTVTITVNNVDDQATAQDFAVTTNEDTPVQIEILLSYIDDIDDNDVGPNDIVVNNPSNGTQSHSPCSCSNRTFTYTPNADWNGTDTMTYKVSFQNSPPYHYSELATITVTVNPVDDLPTAQAVSASVDEDSSVDITLLGSDVDGDDLTYSIVTNALDGSVSLTGSVATYTPNPDYYGSDSFIYRVNDGTSDSNTSSVNITINGLPEKHTYDLSNDYDEWFSDIVYDASTGGYIVTGYAQEVGDNGTSTISMLHLNTTSTNFAADVFTKDISGLDMMNSGWGDRFSTAHSFDISERSRNGTYTINNTAFLWTITNQGVATGSKASSSWSVTGDGDYVYIDNLSLSIEADDGSGFVVQGSIYGRESGGSPDRENFPIIVKTDNTSEMQYYLALNYNTDASKFYSWDARGIYSNPREGSNVYGFIGVEKRIGFNNQNTVWFYVVTDTGSSFEVNHRVDITNISSAMQLTDISWKRKEFALHSMSKGQDARLVLLGESSNGVPVIAAYWIDLDGFPGTGTHRLDGYETIPDSDWYELMNCIGSGQMYFASQHGSDILVRRYNQNGAQLMSETILDVDGNNSDDRFGGITHSSETDGHGVVITGSTKCATCSDFDGFIIELNQSLERVYEY